MTTVPAHQAGVPWPRQAPEQSPVFSYVDAKMASREPQMQRHLSYTERWASLRLQVGLRIMNFNTGHAREAWQRRYSYPIAPWAIAIHVAEPNERSVRPDLLRTAARLDGTDETVGTVNDLLRVLTGIARGRGPHLNALSDEFITYIERLTGPTKYLVGLSVSSLDTPKSTWEETQRTASGWHEVRGRAFAYLCDGSIVVVDRGRGSDDSSVRFRSNMPPAFDDFDPSLRRWQAITSLDTDLPEPETWERLYELCGVIAPTMPNYATVYSNESAPRS